MSHYRVRMRQRALYIDAETDDRVWLLAAQRGVTYTQAISEIVHDAIVKHFGPSSLTEPIKYAPRRAPPARIQPKVQRLPEPPADFRRFE